MCTFHEYSFNLDSIKTKNEIKNSSFNDQSMKRNRINLYIAAMDMSFWEKKELNLPAYIFRLKKIMYHGYFFIYLIL